MDSMADDICLAKISGLYNKRLSDPIVTFFPIQFTSSTSDILNVLFQKASSGPYSRSQR